MPAHKTDGIKRVLKEIGEQQKHAKDIMTETTSEADVFQPDRPKPELRVVSGEKNAAAKAPTLMTAKASSYTMRGITWFWPNRFSIGKLALIGGCQTRARG
jgi:hypothetical protein